MTPPIRISAKTGKPDMRGRHGHTRQGPCMARRGPPLEERFWAKVSKTDACWIWTGNRVRNGYGKIRRPGKDGASPMAHVLSWELHNGPVPAGLLVCHRCDNPPCVRPDHLFLGTHKDNSDDKIAKGRARYALGNKNPSTKLTVEAVRSIKASLRSGESMSALARRCGVASTTIAAIKQGRTWVEVA